MTFSGTLLRATTFCLALIFMAVPSPAGDDPPVWLRQAAQVKGPVYDSQVPAVVLLNEVRRTVEDDGRILVERFYAVRILNRDGRSAAVAREIYTTDTGKVRQMRAWVLRQSGEVKHYDKDKVLDLAMVDNDVYNEIRLKAIIAGDDVNVGDIFGYEVVTEDRSVFSQCDWQFQSYLPALVSRFTLSLPKNWRSRSVTFNHAEIVPLVNNTTFTWELRDLPYIKDEPARPAITKLVPRLAVSYFPPESEKASPIRTFENWKEVSIWLSELNDSQAVMSDALIAKARELTESADSEFERIRAIGRYVQSVNYISIQTGIGRGGGYRSHAATDVFSRFYGDCKDKANLMRTMLKAVGISSFLVSIYSGDPSYVQSEWPSPQQFNHCIIAVKLNGETDSSAMIRHPALGHLLIFDPTDVDTPVGELPDHQQGSLALIIAGSDGDIVRMPDTPPEANGLERQIDIVMTEDGSITADVHEQAMGHSAVDFRSEFRSLSRSGYLKMIEKWVSRNVTGAAISEIEPVDNSEEGRFSLKVGFKASSYAQALQGRLLVFRPAIVSSRLPFKLTEDSRHHPVVFKAQAFTETVCITLPAGYEVDELPENVETSTTFGRYRAKYEVIDRKIVFSRELVIYPATVSVEEYSSVRKLFECMDAAENAQVVIVRE